MRGEAQAGVLDTSSIRSQKRGRPAARSRPRGLRRLELALLVRRPHADRDRAPGRVTRAHSRSATTGSSANCSELKLGDRVEARVRPRQRAPGDRRTGRRPGRAAGDRDHRGAPSIRSPARRARVPARRTAHCHSRRRAPASLAQPERVGDHVPRRRGSPAQCSSKIAASSFQRFMGAKTDCERDPHRRAPQPRHGTVRGPLDSVICPVSSLSPSFSARWPSPPPPRRRPHPQRDLDAPRGHPPRDDRVRLARPPPQGRRHDRRALRPRPRQAASAIKKVGMHGTDTRYPSTITSKNVWRVNVRYTVRLEDRGPEGHRAEDQADRRAPLSVRVRSGLVTSCRSGSVSARQGCRTGRRGRVRHPVRERARLTRSPLVPISFDVARASPMPARTRSRPSAGRGALRLARHTLASVADGQKGCWVVVRAGGRGHVFGSGVAFADTPVTIRPWAADNTYLRRGRPRWRRAADRRAAHGRQPRPQGPVGADRVPDGRAKRSTAARSGTRAYGLYVPDYYLKTNYRFLDGSPRCDTALPPHRRRTRTATASPPLQDCNDLDVGDPPRGRSSSGQRRRRELRRDPRGAAADDRRRLGPPATLTARARPHGAPAGHQRAPPNMTVELRCSGPPHCPFKRRTTTAARGGRINVLSGRTSASAIATASGQTLNSGSPRRTGSARSSATSCGAAIPRVPDALSDPGHDVTDPLHLAVRPRRRRSRRVRALGRLERRCRSRCG